MPFTNITQIDALICGLDGMIEREGRHRIVSLVSKNEQALRIDIEHVGLENVESLSLISALLWSGASTCMLIES